MTSKRLCVNEFDDVTLNELETILTLQIDKIVQEFGYTNYVPDNYGYPTDLQSLSSKPWFLQIKIQKFNDLYFYEGRLLYNYVIPINDISLQGIPSDIRPEWNLHLTCYLKTTKPGSIYAIKITRKILFRRSGAQYRGESINYIHIDHSELSPVGCCIGDIDKYFRYPSYSGNHSERVGLPKSPELLPVLKWRGDAIKLDLHDPYLFESLKKELEPKNQLKYIPPRIFMINGQYYLEYPEILNDRIAALTDTKEPEYNLKVASIVSDFLLSEDKIKA